MEAGLKHDLFTELFAQHQLPLYRYLFQLCRNREIVEELLQETFYRAMISLDVKKVIQVRAWLFKVAHNLYIDSTRKSKSEQRMIKRIQADYHGHSTIGNPEQQLAKKTRQEELELLLKMLPERMQTILYLREIQEFSYHELATTMNFTDSQVKTTLHRAKSKFRQYSQLYMEGIDNEER